MTKKAWGGRFSGEALEWVEEFNASIHFDKVLLDLDIKGSIAHAEMLASCDIISAEDKDTIVDGLHRVKEEVEKGNIEWNVKHEDIHMNVEHRSEEHTSELQSRGHLVCRLLLEKKKKKQRQKS